MFRVKPQAIGDIIGDFLKEEGLEGQLLERRAVDAWDDIAGPAVAARTKKKFMKNQTLFVEIDSPALRSDLFMRRKSLVESLNAKVGSRVVKNIKFY